MRTNYRYLFRASYINNLSLDYNCIHVRIPFLIRLIQLALLKVYFDCIDQNLVYL